MGCKNSKSTGVENMHGKNHHPEEKVETKLTEFQFDIISCTWPLLSQDLQQCGCKVMLYVFEAAPDLKQLFSYRDVRNDQLMNDEAFQKHALAFMGVICEVVDNVEGLEAGYLGQKLMILGAKHAMIQGFDNAYFAIFKKCVLYTWEMILKEEFTQEVMEVWETILDFIINKMGEGYSYSVMDAIRRQNGSRTSDTCFSESAVSEVNVSGTMLLAQINTVANGKPANGHADHEDVT